MRLGCGYTDSQVLVLLDDENLKGYILPVFLVDNQPIHLVAANSARHAGLREFQIKCRYTFHRDRYWVSFGVARQGNHFSFISQDDAFVIDFAHDITGYEGVGSFGFLEQICERTSK